MKQILCILALAGCMCFAQDTFAQSGKKAKTTTNQKVKKDGVVRAIDSSTLEQSASEKAQNLTAHLKESLSLNARQAESVYKINLATAEKMTNLRSNRDKDIRAFKKGVKATFKDNDTRIQKVLNADQLAKYKKMKKELREKRGAM